MRRPEVQKILFADGSCSISKDNILDSLQFSPSSSLLITQKRATRIRFLTCAAPVEYHQDAKLLLEFRNSIVEQNLIFPDNLLGSKRADEIFQTVEPLLVCRFEKPAKPVVESNHNASSELYWIQLESMDRLVKLRIPSHLQTFEVSFPCRIAETDAASSPNAYTMITQVHPSFDPPRYWVYPLLLAIQSEHVQNHPDLASLKARLESLSIIYRLLDMKPPKINSLDLNSRETSEFDLMPDVVIAGNHLTAKLPSFNHQEYQASHAGNTQFRGHEELASFTKAAEIRAIQTDHGVFRAIKLSSDTVEIQIILADGTIILTTSDFKFLRMWLKGSWVEEMYLVEMVMEIGAFTNHHTGDIYEMREIVTMALSLYQNVHSNMSTTPISEPIPLPSKSKFSSSVKRSVEIPDVGKFTYYTDGRCKAHFHDRTIIEFPSNHNQNGVASILDQSGNRFNIRISNPVGYEDHINAMLDFINFVNENHQERVKTVLQKQKVVDTMTIQREKSRLQSEKLRDLLQQ